MVKYSLVYITAPNMEDAEKLARKILSLRLAACINLYSPVRSLYLWHGQLEEDEEVTIIAKTFSSLVGELAETVRSLHSYDTPCVISVSADYVQPDFAKWMSGEIAH